MTKRELYDFLVSLDDKSGGFKKKESIKKHYPQIYQQLCEIDFPSNFTFIQKLYHFLLDDYTIHKCKCGKETKFIGFKDGYRIFCGDRNCPYLKEHNLQTIQKAQEQSQNPKSRELAVNTIKKKNGGSFWTPEQIENLKQSYQRRKPQLIEKIKNTYKQNYETMMRKKKETYEKNLNDMVDISHKDIKSPVSSIEISFYQYLINKFGQEDIIYQYYDNRYPFMCDFYIKSLDLFIEINGFWTHDNHPFDPNNINDQLKLEELKKKNSKFYNNKIYVWTNLDVRKRSIAKTNQINFLEIFSSKINICISTFEEYIKKKRES